jgi:hypothetical protein
MKTIQIIGVKLRTMLTAAGNGPGRAFAVRAPPNDVRRWEAFGIRRVECQKVEHFQKHFVR